MRYVAIATYRDAMYGVPCRCGRFLLEFRLVPSPEGTARTDAWESVGPLHGNKFDLCWSDASDCPGERCGDDTARMLAARSLTRLLLA